MASISIISPDLSFVSYILRSPQLCVLTIKMWVVTYVIVPHYSRILECFPYPYSPPPSEKCIPLLAFIWINTVLFSHNVHETEVLTIFSIYIICIFSFMKPVILSQIYDFLHLYPKYSFYFAKIIYISIM